MARARFEVEGLPVRNDAARSTTNVPQRPIAPDIDLRVLGMTLDRHRAQRVVRPDASAPTAERAIATRRLLGCEREREADRSAMAGAVKRWWWLFVIHELRGGRAGCQCERLPVLGVLTPCPSAYNPIDLDSGNLFEGERMVVYTKSYDKAWEPINHP